MPLLFRNDLYNQSEEKMKMERFFEVIDSDDTAEAQALLKADPELVQVTDDWGNNPLLLARSKGMIELLLRFGADINVKNMHDRSLMHVLAFRYDNTLNDSIELLLSNGADINARDVLGWTPLHAAADFGDFGAVKCLVLHGADVNLHDNDGRTPLQASLEDEDGNWLEIAEFLAEHGADIRQVSEAIAVGDTSSLESYFDSDPNLLNSTDSHGFTPIHWAVYYNQWSIAEFLLSRNVDINMENSYGRTVLHQAAMFGNILAIEFLIHKGADVNAGSGRDGMTPLMCAVKQYRLEAVDTLISMGAETGIKNFRGDTALKIATDRWREARQERRDGEEYENKTEICEGIISLLRKNGAGECHL